MISISKLSRLKWIACTIKELSNAPFSKVVQKKRLRFLIKLSWLKWVATGRISLKGSKLSIEQDVINPITTGIKIGDWECLKSTDWEIKERKGYPITDLFDNQQ